MGRRRNTDDNGVERPIGASAREHIFGVMMRHSRQRATAWLLAVLLTLVVAEPFRVHQCPVHLRLAAAAVTPAADAHAAHAGHAMPAAASAAAEEHDGGAHGGPVHLCDCLGSCGLAALATLRAHPALWVPEAVAAVDGPPAPDAAPTARAADHVLPFANGPPVVG
jgi:hypothetical protein